MQEGTVAWDPIYVHHPLAWYAKLYGIYLFVVLCVSFVRSLRLAKHVWRFRSRGCVSVNDAHDAKILAEAALKGTLIGGTPADGNECNLKREIMDDASLRFGFLWQTYSNLVESMKRTVAMTLLFAAFVAVAGIRDVLRVIQTQKSTGIGAISGGVAEVFSQLAMGLFVCLVLYAAAILFEGVLARRRARWTYLYSKVRTDVES